MSKLKNLRYDIDKFGLPFALWRRVAARLKRAIGLQILLPNTLSLETADPKMLELDPPFRFQVLSREECLALAAEPANQMDGLKPERVRTGYDRGESCYAIFDRDRLASFGWFAATRGPIDDRLAIHCNPEYRYFFWGYTPPEYRGRRLHGIGIVHAIRYATETLGAKGMIGYIDSNNHYSLRSAKRLGYHFFGKVYVLRAFGRYFIHATRGCAPYGVRVTAD